MLKGSRSEGGKRMVKNDILVLGNTSKVQFPRRMMALSSSVLWFS